MMEPVSLVVVLTVATGVFLTSSIGYAMGRRQERRAPALLAARDTNRELQSRIVDLERELAWSASELERKDTDIVRLSAQRDRFKEIAASHEVKYPERPKVPRHPWDKRRFCAHPKDNLASIQKELRPYKGHEVKMTIRVSGAGQFSSWGRILKQKWGRTDPETGKRVPIDELGPWVYHGDVDRAFRDFSAQILDDDSGFVAGKDKSWKDGDSPILFEVSLEICDVAPPELPEIHTVQVAVVEEVIVREVVERPIYISIPEGQEADLCGHTAEQIKAHIQEVMDRARAEEEIEALGSLGADCASIPEAEREARARRALQQSMERG